VLSQEAASRCAAVGWLTTPFACTIAVPPGALRVKVVPPVH
jgi:hypothetical protein